MNLVSVLQRRTLSRSVFFRGETTGVARTRVPKPVTAVEPWDLSPSAPYYWALMADTAIAEGALGRAEEFITLAYACFDDVFAGENGSAAQDAEITDLAVNAVESFGW